MNTRRSDAFAAPLRLRAEDAALVIVDAQLSSFDPVTSIEPIHLRDNLIA